MTDKDSETIVVFLSRNSYSKITQLVVYLISNVNNLSVILTNQYDHTC